jgi:hypothetical protein
MLPEKAALDRELQAGAVFGRLTAMLGQKRPVDLLDVDTTILTGLTVLAISRSFRIATSGLAKELGSLYFI